MSITIHTEPLSYTKFRGFIISSANWFAPSLLQMPNLDEWILKMYHNGSIYYAISGPNIISLIVGYYNREERFLYIPYVCVHPDYQGHGISQKIINYIIEHLSTDIQEILLEVRKDNNNALQAYHKMGFYETEDRDEKYLMKKEIHNNHGLYISQCLDGFLMQKTNFPFEILIHDDASTDNTPDIIREYEHNHPQVIRPIYQKENKYSKKEDIFAKYQCSRVRGKYIAICEGDDYWIDPLKLQKQIDFLEKNPDYGMIYTTSKVYNQKEGKIEEDIIGREYKGYIELLSGNCIPTLTTCIRSSLVMEYLKEVEPKSKNWLMGDYPMWLWISYYYKIKYLPESTTVYRVLEESASHSNDIQKYERFILSTIDITAFYIHKFNTPLTEPYLRSLSCFYYDLYDKFMYLGMYKKARHYSKLINPSYVSARMRRRVRRFHLRFIQLRLEKWLNIKGNKRK